MDDFTKKVITILIAVTVVMGIAVVAYSILYRPYCYSNSSTFCARSFPSN